MCGGPEQAHAHVPLGEGASPLKGKRILTLDVEKGYDNEECLLELAADDDLDRFRRCVEEKKVKVDVIGTWYVRRNGARQMVVEQRTPAMIAALYGSINVLAYIMNQYAMHGGNIDQPCGYDASSALHCAAAGGSPHALQVVKLLLDSGASVDVCDIEGRRPADVIAVPLGLADMRVMLQELLGKREPLGASAELESSISDELKGCFLPSSFEDIGFSSTVDVLSVESCSTSSAFSTLSGASASSFSLSASSSPKSPHTCAMKGSVDDIEKAREYSVDLSLPDIKNTFYTNDEFRMYSFKIRPCSRAYSHDWTECPFAHPGENARRRDPRRYHYSCVPCPDFRKGACSQGDTCEYAHGVFECWLHPAQYRTRLCKDGAECNRKVCFFAHMPEELRPVYASTGSGLPSPISSAFTDMVCMSPPLAPCSLSMMSPFSSLHPVQSSLQGSLRTPPMSPSSSPASAPWPQPSIPTLHLPGTASLQASRLRAALSARDVSANKDFDEQLVNDFQSLAAHSLSTQARLNAAVAASGNGTASSRGGRHKSLGLTVAPANLEELFALETPSSPGMSVHKAPLFARLETESHLLSQTSPRKQSQVHAQCSVTPSPRGSFFNLGSLSSMSRQKGPSVECDDIINAGSVSPALVAARATLSQGGNKGSQSFRDLGSSCVWSDWGSPMGKPEWGMQEEDLSKLRRSVSFRMRRDSDESDLSWVQKSVKEGLLKNDSGGVSNVCYDSGNGSVQKESADLSWIDNLCLDRYVG